MAIEAFRAHRLTWSHLRLLGIPSLSELEARFLRSAACGLAYSLEDFRREGKITAPLPAERRKEGDQEQRSR